MTLKEAQKKWDDAIQMKVTHRPDTVTAETLINAANFYGKAPAKILFISVGKTSSRVIYSRMAAKEEDRQQVEEVLIPLTDIL